MSSQTEMSQFTCVSCHVAFQDADTQRMHYKTDWHRYNLKRKVAELPPVSPEEFQRRVYQQREKEQFVIQDQSTYCTVCKKSFGNTKAFDNHINSKKHKDLLKHLDEDDRENIGIPCEKKIQDDVSMRAGMKMKTNNDDEEEEDWDDEDIEEVDSDEWENETSDNNPVASNNCLFCPHHSRSLYKNLQHMTAAHTFFIPDLEYVVNLEGLLLYLGEKVCQGFICLWCNDEKKTFHSLESTQQHMVDKGHCKMLHDGKALLEYFDFYDYSSSYPEVEETTVAIEPNVLDDASYELVLPSGASIGHRSLAVYYRQSLDATKNKQNTTQKKINKIISHYKGLGYTAETKEVIKKKARDIHYMHRVMSKYSTQLSFKANKMQHHFRAQVMF
uniref:Zinc finger protein 622 n=2 Tax=Cacopsylla melanoneura TaxID=428564 RepID=A0A8D8V8R1_9HEMI